ncbi:uncharacterized protein LOC123562681 isoform X2 [Mercenaria mercenaria]|uniref:uncharacterized protein LOC123562681 isoform X2 n=1 Tax=Mercenaria mercenaria TaxID=6596 RepID=UPI00234F5987|nr:uncharacterized protein LOC123562681 isoform X2 [Mercenaria mercenaria]
MIQYEITAKQNGYKPWTSEMTRCRSLCYTYDQSVYPENNSGQSGNSIADYFIMADAGMVQRTATANLFSIRHSTKTSNTNTVSRSNKTPSHSEDAAGCFRIVREQLKDKGLSEDTVQIILQSWKKSAAKQNMSIH